MVTSIAAGKAHHDTPSLTCITHDMTTLVLFVYVSGADGARNIFKVWLWSFSTRGTSWPHTGSCRFVDSLVQAEVSAGIPESRIVVAGFSQGGAMALHSLRQGRGFAGVIGAPAALSVVRLFCVLSYSG